MRASKILNFHGLNEPLIIYRVHQNNFSKKNTDIFYEEFLLWYNTQFEINDQDFLDNRICFKKITFLEINHLLLNKKKSFILLKKILKYPNILQMIKFIIGFILPKKIIKLLKD